MTTRTSAPIAQITFDDLIRACQVKHPGDNNPVTHETAKSVVSGLDPFAFDLVFWDIMLSDMPLNPEDDVTGATVLEAARSILANAILLACQ
jgi:hypothetical protein